MLMPKTIFARRPVLMLRLGRAHSSSTAIVSHHAARARSVPTLSLYRTVHYNMCVPATESDDDPSA